MNQPLNQAHFDAQLTRLRNDLGTDFRRISDSLKRIENALDNTEHLLRQMRQGR